MGKTKFIKGDYIIQLSETASKYLSQNYCYKQFEDNTYLYSEKDNCNSKTSSSYVHFNKPETWRYASQQEIEEYDRLGKPYDVTTLIDLSEIQEYLPEGHADKINSFILPEKWCVKFTSENREILSNWIKSQKGYDPAYSTFKMWCLSDNKRDSSYMYWGGVMDIGYQEITIEQFKKYILNNKMKNKRFPFNLKQEDAIKILNIACDAWTGKLSNLWSKDIYGQNKYTTITEEFYKEMRNACSREQHKLFDEIFGKDKKPVEYHIGQRFKIEGDEYILANSGQRNVLLINLIDGTCWNDPIDVNNAHEITEYEMEKITCGIRFELIS